MKWPKLLLITLVTSAALLSARAQESPRPHPGKVPEHAHEEHAAGVDHRGDKGMGFSHEKTTHHFRLLRDGGAIEVTANAADDTTSRDQIRAHLQHIAQLFAAGDFDIPKFVHGQIPAGAEVMREKKSQILYRYEELERGGRVRISTTDPQALAAVHEFLRFQIKDHRTGDPTEVGEQ